MINKIDALGMQFSCLREDILSADFLGTVDGLDGVQVKCGALEQADDVLKELRILRKFLHNVTKNKNKQSEVKHAA